MAKDNIKTWIIFKGRIAVDNAADGARVVEKLDQLAALDQRRENNLKHRKVKTDNGHRKQDKIKQQLPTPNQHHADNPKHRKINTDNDHRKQKKPDQLAAPNQRHADNPKHRGINDGNGHHKQDQLPTPNQRHADNPKEIAGKNDNKGGLNKDRHHDGGKGGKNDNKGGRNKDKQ